MSRRVVSLVPSSTETLLALGADVVACTRFCEQPSLPHVGGTKNPDLDAIVTLRPDVVVVDREENRIDDHDALLARGVEVFASDVTTVGEALAVIDQLAAVAGVEVPPDLTTSSPAPLRAAGRTAFVPIWRRPWMSIGDATYGASLLEHLGLRTATPGDDPYPTVDLDAVGAAQPDLVLVPSEPYDFSDDHVAELERALPAATVRRIDGQDLFWWGSRTPGAITRLAAALGLPPTA